MSVVPKCVDHSQAAAAGPCKRCGSFLCADCLLGGYCESCLIIHPAEPRALGGWLILAMLSLFGTALRLVATAIPIVLQLRKVPDLGAALGADPRWFAFNGFDLAVGLILTGTSLFAMPAFFGKKRVAIMRMQIVFACVLCTNVVTPLIIAMQSTPSSPPTNPVTTFWPVVLPLLWINYFRTSPRVKETFVR